MASRHVAILAILPQGAHSIWTCSAISRVTGSHAWRTVPSRLSGERLDLNLTPPSAASPEVWATLRESQLTVGAAEEHTDFEGWGRPMSDEQVAAEAFEFVPLSA